MVSVHAVTSCSLQSYITKKNPTNSSSTRLTFLSPRRSAKHYYHEFSFLAAFYTSEKITGSMVRDCSLIFQPPGNIKNLICTTSPIIYLFKFMIKLLLVILMQILCISMPFSESHMAEFHTRSSQIGWH